MSTEYIKETDKSTFYNLGFMSKNIVWMLMSLKYCIHHMNKAKKKEQKTQNRKTKRRQKKNEREEGKGMKNKGVYIILRGDATLDPLSHSCHPVFSHSTLQTWPLRTVYILILTSN